MRETIENVLASRYATTPMLGIFSARAKVIAERRLWLAILRTQAELGVPTPEGAIEAYEAVIDQVDFASMRQRELKTQQDVKARIEEFCALAGFEVIHRAMTSRDLTDNIEQYQIRQAFIHVRDHLVAVLFNLNQQACAYHCLPLAARTHNVAAQVTTLGKRFATAIEELLSAFATIERLVESYPLRGIKGPVGTAADQLELLGGDQTKLAVLERRVAEQLGFNHVMDSVGQVYPRSFDFQVVSALAQAAAGPASLATTIRLMAGYELATEGFKEGQVGSTAMPHKRNARTSERICGFNVILHGHVAMIGHLSGTQWQEGDVSCSVVRRVVIPDAFFTIDGLIEATLTVLANFGLYLGVIISELDRYLPFLATTKILVAAMKAGIGRETAHAAIKQHALATALSMAETGQKENDFYWRLSGDGRLGMTQEQIRKLVGHPMSFIGDTEGQINRIAGRVKQIVNKYPEAAYYQPEPIL